MEEKICPNCQSKVKNGARFCSNCGYELSADQAKTESETTAGEITCPQCKKVHSKPLQYCDACGYPLPQKIAAKHEEIVNSEGNQPVPPVDKTTPKKLRESRIKKITGKKYPLKNILIFTVVFIAILAIGYLVYKTIGKRPDQAALFDSCTPIKPDNSYTLANTSDLSGDLKRDSYFESGQEYKIEDQSTFVIPAGRTLIIEPGARVRFGKDARMLVKGTLLACGQTNRRILFTADTTTGVPGFWQGIEFSEADIDSILGHVTIEYAGGNNHSPLWIENVDLKLQDIKFDNNAWYAVSIDPNSYPLVRENIKIDNSPQGWEVRGGKLAKSINWKSDPVYVINGVLEIQENARLSLSEGAILRFLPSSGLVIKGEFITGGTEQNTTIFTSVNDFDDETLPDPKPGDWYGIRVIGSSARPVMNYSEIRYAGQQADASGCLLFSEASGSFTNIRLSHCGSYSISTDVLSNPEFTNLLLEESDISQELEVRGGELKGIVNGAIPQIKAVNPDRVLLPVVTSWIGVGKEAKLTIKAGSNVLFTNGRNSGLWIEGELSAPGTDEEPIVLTSLRDSTYNPKFEPKAGDWGGIYLKNSTLETVLSNLEIKYAGVERACVYLDNASPQIQDVTISKCAVHPISSDINSQPEVTNLVIADNLYANQWLIRESASSGRINLVWDEIQAGNNTSITRVIDGIITIAPEAILELKPGLILKFGQSGGLKIQGSFSALGEQDAPILLTSWRDPVGGGKETGARAGDWQGVWLNGQENKKELRNIHIAYGGQSDRKTSCLTMENSKPILEDITITACGYYPIASDLQSQPVITNIALTDNYPSNDWNIYESRLSQGQQVRWNPIYTKDEMLIPRLVTGWINVDSGAKLTIGEGNVVKFNQRIGVYSHGILEVLGTEDNPVVLTSWRDPEVSREGNVQAGDWSGIRLQGSNQETIFLNTQIRYAGGESQVRGALVLESASPVIHNVKIFNSGWYPISSDLNSNPSIESIQLIDSQPGNVIEVRQSSLSSSGEYLWYPIFDVDQNPIPRVVTGELLISKGSALLLEPETVVKFTEAGNVEINGGFTSTGAVLTSASDPDYAPVIPMNNPAWGGIRAVHSEGIQIINVTDTIINQAQVGLWVENLSIEINNSSIQNCTQAAISADLFSNLHTTNLKLINNSINGVLIRGESLNEGVLRWRQIDEDSNLIARVFQNSFTIGSKASLILEPGVIIKFYDGTGMVVDGELKTGSSPQGEENSNNPNLVILTPISDDEYGGDTDNKQSVAVRGAWLGLDVNPRNTNAIIELVNTRVQFAKIGVKLTNMPEWKIVGLVISDSQLYGISCDVLSSFPAKELISFINNGQEVLGCPTPDR